ncbi:hypothetical protein FGO68_gene7909 [Halteria grandinella]|uniref:Uncharacterized protein n=1 Tax=Halteria grandinella TaxID=5974 RepID=A0A8J8NCU2_HALGN|nr:hypothetical protein FGO68_gene7909 [Halteria grandinella]
MQKSIKYRSVRGSDTKAYSIASRNGRRARIDRGFVRWGLSWRQKLQVQAYRPEQSRYLRVGKESLAKRESNRQMNQLRYLRAIHPMETSPQAGTGIREYLKYLMIKQATPVAGTQGVRVRYPFHNQTWIDHVCK